MASIQITIGKPVCHAVDFDGTLAEYNGYEGPYVLGKPIPAMVRRVKEWLAAGDAVTLFTARVCADGDPMQKIQVTMLLQKWCEEHLGQAIPITDRKLPTFTDFWDDRAVAVERNTGRPLSPEDPENVEKHSDRESEDDESISAGSRRSSTGR